MPISTGLLRKYRNNTFVETGTYGGHGVDAALEAGFHTVFSIESNLGFYWNCINRFVGRAHIRLLFGESQGILPGILRHIAEPVTFWLDAHWWEELGSPEPNVRCPILEELSAIAQHAFKTHTILIDDVRIFRDTPGAFAVTLDEVIGALQAINPNYQLGYEDGFQENDILVARVNAAFGR